MSPHGRSVPNAMLLLGSPPPYPGMTEDGVPRQAGSGSGSNATAGDNPPSYVSRHKRDLPTEVTGRPLPEQQRKRRKRNKDPDPIGFQPGNHAIVSGATGKGKTKYTVDAILGTGVHEGRKGPWDAVVVMCDNISINQKEYKRLRNKFKGAGDVTFVEGLPKDENEEKEKQDEKENA